jgi:hypothetical protein
LTTNLRGNDEHCRLRGNDEHCRLRGNDEHTAACAGMTNLIHSSFVWIREIRGRLFFCFVVTSI